MARYTPTKPRVGERTNSIPPVTTMTTEDIWKYWCLLTKPDHISVPTGVSFPETNKEQATHWIRLASFLAPRGDILDAQRLVEVFTDPDTRNEAEGISTATHAQPISNPTKEQSRVRSDIIARIRKEESEMTPSEKRSLYRLSADHRISRILDLLTPESDLRSIESMLDDTRMYPSVRKENYATRESFRKIVLPPDAYAAGRKVEKTYDQDEMEADVDATMMLVYGFSVDEMIAYHEQAPAGYWKAAAAMLTDPVYGGDPAIVYSELEQEFRFHPSQRVMPEKS